MVERLTDIQFEELMNLNKYFTKKNIQLPTAGESESFDLAARETDDKFFLDADRRGRIELKIKLQTRYALTKLPLVRIDLNSPPHINPDGTKVSRNHIHIYKDSDYNTGNLPWAYELNTIDIFAKDDIQADFMQIFYHFCEYCRIETYSIQGVI